MNKKELIAKVAERGSLEVRQAEQAVNALIDSVADALQRGESVALMGFGAFSIRHRAARTGRNPVTGQAIAIAARSVPVFKAATALNDKVAAGAGSLRSDADR